MAAKTAMSRSRIFGLPLARTSWVKVSPVGVTNPIRRLTPSTRRNPLPTAPAHFALGDIAKVRGNRDEAIEHYKVVSSAGGEYGQAATTELVKLDLTANPGTYVNHGCSADGNGNLVVSVRNETTVQIGGVVVAVLYTDANGGQQQQRFSIRGQIPAGQVASVNTGLGPYTAGSNCPVRVVAAEIAE